MKQSLQVGSEAFTETFRSATGAFLTGVALVTALDSDGKPRGMTINSFTSVSIDPPLVLFCVDKLAAGHETYISATGFAIHILGDDQQDLARLFASKAADKFSGLQYQPGTFEAPVLEGVHAWFDCAHHQALDAGDHTILIGKVIGAGLTERRPLGFYRGQFQSFSADHELALFASGNGGAVNVSWLLETLDGKIALFQRRDGSFGVPRSKVPAPQLYDAGLSSTVSREYNLPVSIDFIYSMYETPTLGMTLAYRGRINAISDELPEGRLVYVPAEEVNDALIPEPAERAMLQRYKQERLDASFGLYAGTRTDGHIADISRIKVDERKSGLGE